MTYGWTAGLSFCPGRFLSLSENFHLEGVPLSKLLSSHSQGGDGLLCKMNSVMKVSQTFQ